MSKNYLQTNLLKKQSRSILITLSVIIFSSMIYLSACKKDPIYCNFDGNWTSSDGWEIELSVNTGIVVKEGTPRSSNSSMYASFIIGNMHRTSNNSWAGTVKDNKFETDVSGTATINGDVLTITPVGYPSYSFTKIPGTGTGTGTGGSGLSGDWYSDACALNDKGVIWHFDGKNGYFSNKDCNYVCTDPFKLAFTYTVSGDKCTVTYLPQDQQDIIHCTGYTDHRPAPTSTSGSFTFAISGTTMTVNSGSGPGTFTR